MNELYKSKLVTAKEAAKSGKVRKLGGLRLDCNNTCGF